MEQMFMKKISIALLSLALVSICLVACNKKEDVTPTRNLAQGKNYTIADLNALATCTNGCVRRFNEEAYLTVVVAADESSGNLYEELYVQDNTGSLHLSLTDNSYFLVGDQIRVNLKGLDVTKNSQSNMIEIDSINYEKQIVKTGSNQSVTITDLNISEISNANFSQLVRFKSVNFIPNDTAKLWADPINKNSLNRTIRDCGGSTLIVRTSGYADFAGRLTPKGSVDMVGIVTNFLSTKQFVVRSINEVTPNLLGCVIYQSKNFNDNSLTSGNWANVNVVNSNALSFWSIGSFSNSSNPTPYAKVSGFIGSATNSENWLISPSIDLSNSVNPTLFFQTAARFAGPPLEVKVSTDYSSGAPSSGTWSSLNAALSSTATSYVWTPSGAISLAAYKTNNVRIAFRYTSTTASASTYQVDDILIREN